MNAKRQIALTCLLAIALSISGCASLDFFATPTPLPTSTATLTPTFTLTPTPTATPTLVGSTGLDVLTPWGVYTITDVQHALRLPPDCNVDLPDDCIVPPETGIHILILYWKKIAPGVSEAAPDDIARSGAYVGANDGTRADLISHGILSGEEYIAFKILASSFSYILYWPGNQPVNLGSGH